MQNLIEQLIPQYPQLGPVQSVLIESNTDPYIMFNKKSNQISLSVFVKSSLVSSIMHEPLPPVFSQILSHSVNIILGIDSLDNSNKTLHFFVTETSDNVIQELYPMNTSIQEFYQIQDQLSLANLPATIEFTIDKDTGLVTSYNYHFINVNETIDYNFEFDKDCVFIKLHIEHITIIDKLPPDQQSVFNLDGYRITQYVNEDSGVIRWFVNPTPPIYTSTPLEPPPHIVPITENGSTSSGSIIVVSTISNTNINLPLPPA